ncbi:TIGR03086 family metal-binding protein [Kutzneria kofuensis]|uniref:Uncharacterized protein (TIGR03086 family) n=1 Tax=Kutzneria kofuensis TaxID=103725 RepID=A0A7W9NMD2_9PSEU|nr:TIGR03086 family metal-binding protein [Kutzneria kofuensis]MBB5897396.1 uncharacterized protein (TIGR03086 family) [Kutzneria kofuensis]
MLIERATAPLLDLIPELEPHLEARTPCTDYTVRQLINHLLFWAPSLTGGATKEAIAPPAAAESDLDLTTGDCLAALTASITTTVKAWSDPAAWEGTTYMGGPMELPAELVGAMVAGEFVVHGWDLARAAGRDLPVDPDIAEYLEAELAKTAEQARQMGIFGPEVAVAKSAPAMHRVLGLTGRDPGWTVS